MKRLVRAVVAAAAVGIAVAVAACVPSPSPEAPREAATPTVQAPPRPAPVQTPAYPNAPFAWSGEMTQGGWIKGTVPPGTLGLTLDGKPVAISRDGQFFAAFDRDAAPEARLVLRRADGSADTRSVQVSPRGWRIERLNIPRRPGGATEAFMRIREPELARINAARAKQTDAQGWRQKFIWPATGRISGVFGSQRIYRGEPGAYHSGLDVAGPTGTPFVAPADGVVILAAKEPFTLEGHLLMIDHGNGLNSAFLHCSELLVNEGDRVRQGQVIGKIGTTGRSTGPHLHWGMKWNDARIDPILLTGPMR